MKIVRGNLLTLAQEGNFDVIVHGCNCFHTMGAGIAKQIATEYPEAYAVDKKTKYADITKLGTISSRTVKRHGISITIVNAYTQFRFGSDGIHVTYDAISNCMKEIKLRYEGKRIGMPKIGAGLGGGNWTAISQIIENELGDMDVVIVDYVP